MNPVMISGPSLLCDDDDDMNVPTRKAQEVPNLGRLCPVAPQQWQLQNKCGIMIELHVVGAAGINYRNIAEFITYEIFRIILL